MLFRHVSELLCSGPWPTYLCRRFRLSCMPRQNAPPSELWIRLLFLRPRPIAQDKNVGRSASRFVFHQANGRMGTLFEIDVGARICMMMEEAAMHVKIRGSPTSMSHDFRY